VEKVMHPFQILPASGEDHIPTGKAKGLAASATGSNDAPALPRLPSTQSSLLLVSVTTELHEGTF
jgi:hypothetical protein